jgi:hypothetical protein
VSVALGIGLLLIGVVMVLLGRQPAHGQAYIAVPNWMFGLYPALCLVFLAFGAAIIVMGS